MLELTQSGISVPQKTSTVMRTSPLLAPQGVAPQGVAPQGVAPQGVAPQGAVVAASGRSGARRGLRRWGLGEAPGSAGRAGVRRRRRSGPDVVDEKDDQSDEGEAEQNEGSKDEQRHEPHLQQRW